jgi:hypothetical protein
MNARTIPVVQSPIYNENYLTNIILGLSTYAKKIT